MDLALRRRFFAEEIEAVAKLRSPALVDALASVPRERFLPPGPWSVLAEADFTGIGMAPMKTRLTPDADPARVYHNIAIAIDAERQLFNGQPATLAPWIDALELAPGSRVLHVGCGPGYYTAVIAACVGDGGRVVALEADEGLAGTARGNLASMPWVEVRADASSQLAGERFDAILVNAGVTHPLDAWLDALPPGGRLILPMTSTKAPMGNIGKGLVFLLTKDADGGFVASIAGFVAIFSAVGIRDDFLNASLGKALMTGPQQWQSVTRLRRDPHDPGLSCWLHGPSFCLSK
jgi:protein-L-isoaspartate(D-aspartate) O-methyltransferase